MRNYKKNIESSIDLAEVKLMYKSKVKKADRFIINSPSSAYEYLKGIYNPDEIEHFESSILVMLNNANEVLGWAKISQGGINGTVVDVRVIYQFALLHNASAILLSHNHPSGNLQPSSKDINITKQIKDGGKIFNIELMDHLIITSEGYTSMRDEGHF